MALASLVALGACTTTAMPDAGDAGPPRDGGRDAGVDARVPRRDAGRDGGRDGGPDAGMSARDPMWEVISSTPDTCALERALRPEVFLETRWTDCGDVEGCLLEVEDPRASPISYVPYTGWHDGTHGYYFAGFHDGEHTYLAVVRTDGRTMAAWRTPSPFISRRYDVDCGVAPAVNNGYVALVYMFFDERAPETNEYQIFHSSIDAIAEMDAPLARMGGRLAELLQSPQWPDVSLEAVAVNFEPVGLMWIFEADGRNGVLGAGVAQGIPQHGRLIGSHVVWEDWAARIRILAGSLDGGTTVLRELTDGDARSMYTDGDQLAWIDARDRQPDGSYLRVELWTGRYDPPSRALADARFVRPLDQDRSGVLGGTWYAQVPTDERIELTSIIDGSRRAFVYPGENFDSLPLYVAASDVALSASRLGLGLHLLRLDPAYFEPIE